MWRTNLLTQGIALLSFLLFLPSCSSEQRGGTETRANQDSSSISISISSAADSGLSVPEADGNRLIVPGERIGQTRIGESLEKVNKILGPPDSSDAGMGHVWEYRRSRPDEGKTTHELDIYASFDEEGTGHYIRQIRVTSPWFITEEGIGTGTPFDAIRSVYQSMQAVAEYEEEEKRHVVYDDAQEGIGFEFTVGADGKPGQCTGIVVHELGRDIRNAYIPRRGYKEIGSQDSQ